MSSYLVTLALGPVQSMIGAARRTRDLWCGSWLLAEASAAAALELHRACQSETAASGDGLIFPAPGNPEQALTPNERVGDDEANIANIIRARITAESERQLRIQIDRARKAATDRIAALCDQSRSRLKGLPIHDELFEAQKNDILEIFAAWVKIENDDYGKAAARLGGLLAARKATRDFKAAARTAEDLGYGIPKSSLDGARESVIDVPHKERDTPKYRTALRKLGLMGRMEELDALGLAKRLAGDVEQFTAYSRVAADSWIKEARERPGFDALKNTYEELVSRDLATRVRGNGGIYQDLPYDAQMLFGFRLDNALSQLKSMPKDNSGDSRFPDDAQQGAQLLNDLRRAQQKLGLGEPVPYAVILKADGDRMGELLNRAKSIEDSREISRSLHSFACSVRTLVRESRGHAIYAGGDDVLAILPLQNAIDCAARLAQSFRETMNPVAERLGLAANTRPTLSVGLGIGHLVEPLGFLRKRADEAEHVAKGNGTATPRNALAIALGVRSGTEVRWRCNWNESPGNPAGCAGVRSLNDFAEAYRNQQCPSRLGYEIRAIAMRLCWVKQNQQNPQPLPGMHEAELLRSLDKARQRGGDGRLSQDFQQVIMNRAAQVGLEQLADELIISRWLSARTQTDIGAME